MFYMNFLIKKNQCTMTFNKIISTLCSLSLTVAHTSFSSEPAKDKILLHWVRVPCCEVYDLPKPIDECTVGELVTSFQTRERQSFRLMKSDTEPILFSSFAYSKKIAELAISYASFLRDSRFMDPDLASYIKDGKNNIGSHDILNVECVISQDEYYGLDKAITRKIAAADVEKPSKKADLKLADLRRKKRK